MKKEDTVQENLKENLVLKSIVDRSITRPDVDSLV